MTVKQLRDWLATQPDDIEVLARINLRAYEPVDPAMWIEQPVLVNLEDLLLDTVRVGPCHDPELDEEAVVIDCRY